MSVFKSNLKEIDFQITALVLMTAVDNLHFQEKFP